MQPKAIPHAPGRRGAVAVVWEQSKFLVIRRSARVVAPRAFCFPGGAIEAGESEEQALVREIREELGVAVEPVRRLWESVTPWEVHLAWWQARVLDGTALTPDPAEVESVHWLTADEMLRLPELLESNRQFFAAMARGEIILERRRR